MSTLKEEKCIVSFLILVVSSINSGSCLEKQNLFNEINSVTIKNNNPTAIFSHVFLGTDLFHVLLAKSQGKIQLFVIENIN